MTCPALEEQVDDGFIALARGPADHLASAHARSRTRISRAIASCASASFVAGFVARSAAEPFFREPLQVIVGCAFGEIQGTQTPSFHTRPVSAGLGQEVRVSDTSASCARVGSTLDADRRPPVSVNRDSSPRPRSGHRSGTDIKSSTAR